MFAVVTRPGVRESGEVRPSGCGGPGGYALFAAVNVITGGDRDRAEFPLLWQLLALVSATVLVVAALTAVPAYLGSRRPVTESLQPEHS